jgi:DNA-directed RNA polymerase subunit RPC12/RpoP
MAISTEVVACLRCSAPTVDAGGSRRCPACGWRECDGAD